jgi:AraC-like DNA-binding protein
MGNLLQISGVVEVAVNVMTRYRCPPHFHDTYSIGVFHGPVRIWCRNKHWAVNPGQVVVLEPREVHSGTADSRNCSQDAFLPDPRLLTALFGSAEPTRFPSPVIDNADLAAELSVAAAMGDRERLSAAFYELFVRYGLPGAPTSTKHAAGEVLRLAIAAAPGARVMDSSRAAGLSPSHFSRRVRALLGLTPRDLLRQKRVSAARALIESGEELSQCAVEAGFADQAHMTRQVRSLTGLTPAALRRKAMKCDVSCSSAPRTPGLGARRH